MAKMYMKRCERIYQTNDDIVYYMAGKSFKHEQYEYSLTKDAKSVMEERELCANSAFKNIDFLICKGEILGYFSAA